MSDAKAILHEIKTMQALIKTVCICSPETKKAIEERVETLSDVILIEDNHVEPNTILVVKDLGLKKALIEMHESKKKQIKGGADNG